MHIQRASGPGHKPLVYENKSFDTDLNLNRQTGIQDKWNTSVPDNPSSLNVPFWLQRNITFIDCDGPVLPWQSRQSR